jgi:hypothetical protein
VMRSAPTAVQKLCGDLNLILTGLRLRGLNGPNGFLRMTGWNRQRYFKSVQTHVAIALNQIGRLRLAEVEPERKRLRITVRHPGVFDEDSLRACVKPLLDGLRTREIKIQGRAVASEQGILKDDSPTWLEHEVLQERGTYLVNVECFSPLLASRMCGLTIEI